MTLHAIIGDVHGCADEYSDLLDLLERDAPSATTIQLGDLVHKGPASAACVQFTMDRVDTVLLGNHELKHLRWLDWERSGKRNPMKNVEDYPEVALTDAQEHYLRTEARLLRRPDPKLVVVHAGIPSSMTSLPPERGWFSMPRKKQKALQVLTMLRYENPRGNMVMLGREGPEDVWWADRYGGRFGLAVYGHQHRMVEGPVMHAHAVGVDLGCVYGGRLCAVLVEDGRVVDHLLVPARQRYRAPASVGHAS